VFSKKGVIVYLLGIAFFVVLIVLVLSIGEPDLPSPIAENSILNSVSATTIQPTDTPTIKMTETPDDLSSVEPDVKFSIKPSIDPDVVESIESDKSYILPGSNRKLLTRSELEALTKKELNFARNEIFARHGYIFKKDVYREYFSKQDWYSEDPNFSESNLNEIEKENVQIIIKFLEDVN
jgi:hypothetical protein